LKIAEVEAHLKGAAFSTRLLGSLQGLRASTEALWDQIKPTDFERVTAEVRSQLDEANFQSAWAEGSKLGLEEVLEEALAFCHERE
jgi:hypothetical protein